jgi:hypothetical protein
VPSKRRSERERRRWSRWYPKKRDDMIIERWAQACSRLNRDCLGCEYADECQDLADRLIGCMSVQGTASRGERGKRVLTRVMSALNN